MEKDPLDTKSIRQEMEEYIVLEEDPELCAMAVTVNVKIVVLNDNSGNLLIINSTHCSMICFVPF